MLRGVLITVMMFMLGVSLVGCNEETTSDNNLIIDGSNLHFILPPKENEFPFIGDVHPFYDKNSETWYMYYLDTSGAFNSKLLTSKNGINWEPTNMRIHSGFQNYAVLNVFEKDGVYYSYYADYQASKRTDLINWYYAGGGYKINPDRINYPAGSRDPDVVYDAETDRFYSISINYLSNTDGKNVSNLAVGATVESDQTEWLATHKPVRSEPVTNSDYECPQLVKIGDRWYIFASRYGQSVHGVGRLSYFIGDKDVNPYDVDWTTKEEYFLTTEDLAAAQVEEKGGKFYVFGWIPRYYNTGFWGGFINLPTEVYALADGTLATRISSDISEDIRGEKHDEFEKNIEINSSQSVRIDTLKRFDVDVDFKLESGVMEIYFEKNNVYVSIENTPLNQKVKINVGNYQTAEMNLRSGALDNLNQLRLIGEGRILQLYLNDSYSIVSRIGEEFSNDEMVFSIVSGNGLINSIKSYRLKFREELNN